MKKPVAEKTAPKPSPAEARRARAILRQLEKAQPDWGPTLRHRNALELLVATILAAQATDEKVNEVTAVLFEKYTRPEDWLRVRESTLQRELRPTGFYRQKTKAVRGAMRDVVDKFGGKVPRDMESLTQLHGVGRKTAAIVLGAAYGVPAIAVDRHVARVAQRLALTKATEPGDIEAHLRARFPRKDWVKATWNLVLHGRRTCFASKPACPRCPVSDLCPWPFKTKL